ncbi:MULTISPECIES: glutamate--tRNA ligase [unclassified Fusibacter]|uniref:glutamate--tRNA ligase n=1 Tax=unclassified Fusibacter TaxID=2624464 RepID=UPI001010F579|nr:MULTISPECIES: glutamate--tRNA ligase [unclassified Fusibacter]MCK8059560.1 glutamate--tRNA ligase [Fusibacter sp. A2]NPE21361.1 glutamate--tRNA ligase [Fusibacter sp. A1]RXV61778.1 glutamate--tRNA ligase [Fusibacter sp. A1]
MSVRVRFAPSPTGYVHIGSLRTALYDYLLAKKMGGKYVIRVEDTDQNRLVDDAIDNLVSVMSELGVVHDEGPFFNEEGKLYEVGDYGPYIQSDRLDIYKPYIEELLESGHAYYCFCSKERLDSVREEQRSSGQTPKYDGLCRDIDREEAEKRIANGESYVVRLKLPKDRNITFKDHVRGEVTFNTNDLDDQVLLKQDGFPTYHFAVVVDDHLMEITHIIRGEEWVSSTPKHVFLYEAFGWKQPEYVHLPLILNSEKKKLSKRHDDAAVEDFLRKGYLKEALINFVALLGWSPEDSEEIMSLDEIVEKFSIDRLSKSGAVFDKDKLKWMNGQYIRKYELDALVDLAVPFFVEAGTVTMDAVESHRQWLTLAVKSLQERVETLADFPEMAKQFIGNTVTPEDDEVSALLKEEHVPIVVKAFIEEVEKLEAVTFENTKPCFKAVQQGTGYKGKQLFMPVRAAISGQMHGVDMNDLLVILGKKTIIERLNYTLEHLV